MGNVPAQGPRASSMGMSIVPSSRPNKTTLIQQAAYKDMILPRLKNDFDRLYQKIFVGLDPDDGRDAVKRIRVTDFDQLKVLGDGAFGHVVLVRHRITSEHYALKVLVKAQIVKMKQVYHVISEKNVARSVDFPFFVGMLASWKDNSNLYMVMPFVVGGELFTYLHTVGRFSERHALFYSAQVVLAFEYLHYMETIYRDLKPENILIESNGYIRITDFGFAKRLGSSLRTWTLCGTPDYMAPEIIL